MCEGQQAFSRATLWWYWWTLRSRLLCRVFYKHTEDKDEKGGSDFRTPSNLSSFGRQILSYKHTNSSGTVVFSHDSRFKKAETIGPGPNLPQMSAMKKQVVSTRRSAESTNFGTSTRDGALKLYTVYTYKRW